MALIPCPNCGNHISSKAIKCPKCGFTLIKTSNIEMEEVIDNHVDDSEVVKSKVPNPQCKIGFIFGILSFFFYEFWAIAPILALVYSIGGLRNFDEEIHKKKWQGKAGAIIGGLYIFAYLGKTFIHR